MHATLAADAVLGGRDRVLLAAFLVAGLLACGVLAYEFLIQKLKLFGTDGDVSDSAYAKMLDGLAAIGTLTAPHPPKSAIFDSSFLQAAN